MPGFILYCFPRKGIEEASKMEFMDINLTKDSRLLLQAIQSPFYITKKTITSSGLKNPYKKIRETRKLESIHV